MKCPRCDIGTLEDGQDGDNRFAVCSRCPYYKVILPDGKEIVEGRTESTGGPLSALVRFFRRRSGGR